MCAALAGHTSRFSVHGGSGTYITTHTLGSGLPSPGVWESYPLIRFGWGSFCITRGWKGREGDVEGVTRDPLCRNFHRQEFACPGVNCCSHSAPVVSELVDALQELRDKVGAPLEVSSGYRCITHNRELESKDTSQHTLGKAADVIAPRNMSAEKFYELADSMPVFLGIGRYTWGLHLDVRNGMRRRWDRR